MNPIQEVGRKGLDGSLGSVEFTYAAAATVGNKLVVKYMTTGNRNVTGITDNNGTTAFVQRGTTRVGDAGRIQWWEGPAAGANPGNNLTLTLSGTASDAIAVTVWELPAAATFVEELGQANPLTDTHASGTVTPTEADNVVLAGMVHTTGDFTLDADFTPVTLTDLGSTPDIFQAATRPQSAATAQEYNATSVDPEYSVISVITYNGVAGGGPAITNVVPNPFTDYQANVGIAGSGFGAVQGAGVVELGDNADHALANLVEQTVTSWADDAIAFTAVRGVLALGPLFLFVTNNAAQLSDGFAVTLNAPSGGAGRAIQQRIRRNL